MKTGKAGTEWVKGRKCTGCRYYVSEARKKSDYIGRCTKFGIGVIDCLCGCRPKKDGGTVLINFEEDVLDKIRNGYSEPEEPAEKEEIMQKQSMTEVEMKTFSYEILPVIRRIREIMEKNGTGSGIRIYMSEKYVSVEGSGLCGWRLNICDGQPEIKFEKIISLDEEVNEDRK